VKGPVVASIVVALASCAVPRPPQAPPRRTKLELNITGGELPNGMRVVLVQDPRAPDVHVTMRYQVGSIDDPPAQRGIAHLVEHLMFQQVLGAETLFTHLERSATEFNAFTAPDATTYVARARTAQLDKLLSVEAVRVGFRCTTISESAFVREREVVVNELKQRDDAVAHAIHAAIYPANHPYAQPMAGTVDSVAAITREQACAFADAHYAPGNAVLVISGDIKTEQVNTALGKFLAKVQARPFTPAIAVPPVPAGGRKAEATAPIERGAVIAAWPLPASPLLRAKLRAIATEIVVPEVDGRVRGTVGMVELGDERAPMLAIAVRPAEGEKLEDAAKGLEAGIDAVPLQLVKKSQLAKLVFDRVQQTALYRLYANLEDGASRDAQLAAAVQAGRAPTEALAAEFEGLNMMTLVEARDLASDHLAVKKATLLTLTEGKQHRTRSTRLTPEIHDFGQRRDPPDPADAGKPAAEVATRDIARMTTRQLPNGMKVVLLPLTSVPTVDVRIVFGRGTADEAHDKRGAAIAAAHALTWDLRYLNDMLLFSAAGGTGSVDAGHDHVSFTARGLDMHIDLLLAGLRRWVRDGIYRDSTGALVEAMRRERKRSTDEGALTDAWRVALFGATHPYARSGLARHASEALTPADVASFRRAHFTPDNATLVIAGRFDAALADKWIDYLFADWTGRGRARESDRATTQPAALAFDTTRTQVDARFALPATAAGRPAQLVVAAMLDDVVGEIRHRLGATYGMNAHLAEWRLATAYYFEGRIDAARVAEVATTLRTRIAELRTRDDATARTFVIARDKVLGRLGALSGRAHDLAERAQRDIELGREPMSDVATAAAIAKLTLDDIAPVLADLDLDKAAILMAGPPAEVDAAYAALGRKPVRVDAGPSAKEKPDAAPAQQTYYRDGLGFNPEDIEDAITKQHPGSRFLLTARAGYATARVHDQSASGPTAAISAGYRLDLSTTVGVQAFAGKLGGLRDVGLVGPMLIPVEITSIEIGAFAQVNRGRLWGQFYGGPQRSRVLDEEKSTVSWVLGLGAFGGVDIMKLGGNRLGLGIDVSAEPFAASNYVALGLSLTYRR
jgi:zinc protease